MSEFRMDGYVNNYNQFGTKLDNSEAYEYLPEALIPDLTLARQYETNGLFAKIIDTPAEEAVRHGFHLEINDSKYESYIESVLDALEWEQQAATAIKWARLFGGAIIVMLIDDGRQLTDPVDWNHIRGIDELRVYERPIVQPDVSSLYNVSGRQDMRGASKFGMPQYYQVGSVYGTFAVHESRCLLFKNGTLPEFSTFADYRFWGMPEYSRIRRALRETITTHSNVAKLMERMVQPVYKMSQLSSLLATDEGEDIVMRRLRVIDRARSFMNSVAIDAEGEDYDFKSFQLSGIKDIIDSTCNVLSAVTNIPQTLLFGRSPAGENSTGDSDLENYYNYVEKIQKMMLKNNLRTVLEAVFRAGATSGEIERVPEYKLAFDPLWSMNDTEQAAVEQARAATALAKAQTAQMYVDMQALDPSEVRDGLASTKEFEVEKLLDDQNTELMDWGLEGLQEVPHDEVSVLSYKSGGIEFE